MHRSKIALWDSCTELWLVGAWQKKLPVKGAIIKSQFSLSCSCKTVASVFVTIIFLHCVGSSRSAESLGARETTSTSTSSPPSSWEQAPSSLKTLCYLQTRVWTIAPCRPWVHQLVNDVAVMLRVVELTKSRNRQEGNSRIDTIRLNIWSDFPGVTRKVDVERRNLIKH